MATVGGVFLFPECRLRVQQCWAALAAHGGYSKATRRVGSADSTQMPLAAGMK